MLEASLFARIMFGIKYLLLNRKLQERWIITGEGETYLKRNGFSEQDLPTFWGGVHEPGNMGKVMLSNLEERYQNASKFVL